MRNFIILAKVNILFRKEFKWVTINGLKMEDKDFEKRTI